MNEYDTPVESAVAIPNTERRRWIKPELRTLSAGSAEAGPNPNVPEGAFALGS